MENLNPLDTYTYSNIGQARAIMEVLGYSENYEKEGQKLTFTKGNETIESSFEDIRERAGKMKDTLQEVQAVSKEFVAKDFDRERATNDLKVYQEELSNNGIYIVKWDKEIFNNERTNDGFSIIDTKNNAAYTGKDLYNFAQENGYFLNPQLEKERQNTIFEIKNDSSETTQKYSEKQIFDILEKRGIDKNMLDKDSIQSLMNGGKTSVLDLKIQDENVKGKLEIKDNNGELVLQLNNSQKVAPTLLKIDGKEIDLAKLFSEDDKIRLQKGEIVNKAVPELKNEKILFQFDKDINSFVAAKEKNINIDFSLPKNERESLLQGNTIRLNTQKGDYLMKLDLLDTTGMRIKKAQDYSQEKDIKFSGGQSIKNDENKAFKKDIARALVAGLLLGCPLLGAYFLLRNIKKSDIDKYKLTSKDVNNLLDGKKTDIKLIDNKEARLSLDKDKNNEVSIKLHPVQEKLKVNDELAKDVKTANEIIKDMNKSIPHYMGDGSTLEVEKAMRNEKELNNILAKYGNSPDIEKFGNVFVKTDAETLLNTGIAQKLEQLPYIKENPLNIEKIDSPLYAVLGEIEDKKLNQKIEDLKFGFAEAKNDPSINEKESFFQKIDKDLDNNYKAKETLNNSLSDFYSQSMMQSKAISLDSVELNSLYKGETLNKELAGDKYLIQIDQKTNELLAVRDKEVIPDKIRDIELSLQQKEDLRKGLPITLDVAGEKVIAQVDLNNKGFLSIDDDRKRLLEFARDGYESLKNMPLEQKNDFMQRYNLVGETNAISQKLEEKTEALKQGEHNKVGTINKEINGLEYGAREKAQSSFEMKSKIDFDRFNAGVVDIIPTDANRAEYMALITKNDNNISIGKSMKM